MQYIHLLIKPASGMCNMHCSYCFYADETSKREVPNYGFMSDETIQNILKNTLCEVTRGCTIAFQGGEPTLAGLDFFKKMVQYTEKYNVNRCEISYAIQTNGLVLDDEWCAFFKKHNFLVGLSLDGPKDLNDRYRVDAAGKGTYSRIMRAKQLLFNHKVDTNVLAVLTRDSCRSVEKTYNFFIKNGLEYQQYIPCLDPLEEVRGGHGWSLRPEDYERYLRTAFDCWYNDAMNGRKKYHRMFDNLLIMADGRAPEACGMSGVCSMQYVFEANGDVFPCDFYMLDDFRIGNLNENTLTEVDAKRAELGFVKQSIVTDPACRTCNLFNVCNGGCRRDRDYFKDGLGHNYFCSAYKSFYPYALPKVSQVYRFLMTGRK